MKQGTVRRTVDKGPMFDQFNLEIFFRGEWVPFGTFGNTNSSNLEWQDAYRKVCQKTLDRFLAGQVHA